MPDTCDARLYLPHVVRNREPILAVLKRVLPSEGLVLEVASGSGEHAAFFAKNLPSLLWQPSDYDSPAIASIAGHRAAAAAANLLAPVSLDVGSYDWPIERANALVCINMIHIAPWTATEGVMAGAERLLGPEGIVYLYGPYRIDGQHTAPSNRDFDTWLRSQDPNWGVRDLSQVVELAARHRFELIETVQMPANNLSIIFRPVP